MLVVQPPPEFLKSDDAVFAIGFFLPGFGAPSIESGCVDPAAFDPGETAFILPAVLVEDRVAFLRGGVFPHSADLLAGAALLVDGEAAILR